MSMSKSKHVPGALLLTHAEGIALDRCSRLYVDTMREATSRDADLVRAAIERAGTRGLAYGGNGGGVPVPARVLEAALRFLGGGRDAVDADPAPAPDALAAA